MTLGLVSGPVEGILTLCIVYAFTAIQGGGTFWQQSMLASLGFYQHSAVPAAIYNLAWDEWYMIYGGIVLVFNTVSRYMPSPTQPMSVIPNILHSAQNVFEARRSRGEPTLPALAGLLPFLSAWILIPAYLYLQPNILHNHLIPFVLYVGLINAYSVGQMITAHLTKSAFPMHNILVVPLVYAVIDSLGPLLQAKLGVGWPSGLGDGVYQVAFVFMCLGLAVGVYGSFVVDVIVSICDYLDIWCLTIKHPQVPEGANGVKKGQ